MPGKDTMSASATPHKLIKGSTGDWEVVIGMEVHAQVTSNAKLFSGASTAFGGEPNSQASVVAPKTYCYPNLPRGYQISQYKSPIVGEGEVQLELDGGRTATVGI